MDLVDLLRQPEGKTLEVKRDLSSPDGVLKTLTAFANTAGGLLLIRVEDRGGHVRGVHNPLDVEEQLANLISDSIAPRLMGAGVLDHFTSNRPSRPRGENLLQKM